MMWWLTDRVKALLSTSAAAFVVAAVAEYKGLGLNLFDLDPEALQLILNAGVDAVLAVFVAWLAPFVKAFGVGSR